MAENKKLRVSNHHGRWGTSKHNGRDFDVSKAEHIDASKQGDNLFDYWDRQLDEAQGVEPSEEQFEQSELRYYKMRFGAALQETNEKYRKKRQYGRIRDMDSWKRCYQYRPEESILQIGNMHDRVDPDVFIACIEDYQKFETEWSRKHGKPFKILNTAIHLDEESPHAHERRVWQYCDENGVWHVGQNEALERAGVPLPNPSEPVGPKNNRKMTLDAIFREKWIEICEQHGFSVERVPNKNHSSHMNKAAYIQQQEINRQKAALEARERDLRRREAEVHSQAQEAAERLQRAEEAVKWVKDKEAELERRTKAVERREILCGRTEKARRQDRTSSGRPLPQVTDEYS